MWNLSYFVNKYILSGNDETICASEYRKNPNSITVKILNILFACQKDHCKCAFDYWENQKE